MLRQNVDEKPLLILITGIMAAGKSTVAQHLAERLPKSVHLRGDVFRRMIVNRQAPMGFDLSPDALAQLKLRYALAATTAAMYLQAGFSVVYQDIILGESLNDIVQSLREHNLHVVVLCPDAETVAAREAGRAKTGYSDLAVASFDDVLRHHTPRLGLWLNTSHQTVSQTVEQILAKLPQAQIQHS